MIRLAVRCRGADSEAVLAELLELAPAGLEQVDEPGGQVGVVEYAIYGAPGELPELGELQAAARDSLVEIRSEAVPNDWQERWKRFYHPVLVDGRIYVRPPWERPAERGGVTEIVIDPGRAFGTGTHATTGMCLELLPAGRAGFFEALGHGRRLAGALKRPRRSFCDLGCGSGVLALAAAKLGYAPVTGVDFERAALEESARNARLNYVEVQLQRLDLRRETAPTADVVTANLSADLLALVAGGWAARDARPGTVIASGFLSSEATRVALAMAMAGLSERRRLERGEWAAMLLSP